MNTEPECPFVKPTQNEARWFYRVLIGNAMLAVLLVIYLWGMKQSMPLFVGLVTVHVLRVRGIYKDHNVLAPHNTVGLITLTALIGAVFAIFARPAFISLIHTMANDPATAQIYGGDYVLAFNSKVVGYGGFWFMGYFLASRALNLAARAIPVLLYPRTKLDVFSAFFDAAENTLGNQKLDEVKAKATRFLKAAEGEPYVARLVGE